MLTRRARAKHRLLTAPYWPIALYLGVIAWLDIAAGGIAPPAMRHVLPEWLVVMWSLALGVGGITAPVGITIGRNRLEASGLVMLMYGAGLYGAVLSSQHLPSRGTYALVALAIVGMCAIRLRVLRQGRKARRVAAEVAAEVAAPETED